MSDSVNGYDRCSAAGGRVGFRLATAAATLAVLLASALAAAPALAVDVWVDDIGGCSTATSCGRDNNSDGTPDTLCCSIKNAICNLTEAAGGTVWVKSGTYNEAFRMRPKVNVRSQSGPTVTTINATSQLCPTSGTFCGSSVECSAVVAGSTVLSDTLLEGFTITGGRGIDLALAQSAKIGGGIVIFGSVQVNNNIIKDNIISGGASDYFGGGIGAWVISSAPRPRITNNTITGNRASPPEAGGTDLAHGFGGGIMMGRGVQATIENNVIMNNQAGNPALPSTAAMVARGGGIFTYGNDPAVPVVITRNLIADNRARTTGGGIAVDSDNPGMNPHTLARITNNEIRFNLASEGSGLETGGGLSSFYATVVLSNNTIHSNTAAAGGGHMVSAATPGTDTLTESNNIYSSNTATGATGGAIYNGVGTCHTVRFEDFWSNGSPQIGGACSDSLIGTNGNIQVNPFYLDSNNSDGTVNLHPDPSSLVVDAGNNADLIPDADGTARDRDYIPRPIDGNLDGTARADIGAYEGGTSDCDGDGTPNYLDTNDDNDPAPDVSDCMPCNAAVYPGRPEVCNIVDDNCDGIIDNDADSDGDGTYNCLDPDDDNDTFADGVDCAPLVPAVHASPGAVDATLVFDSKTNFHWHKVSQGTVYNVYRGTIPSTGWSGYNHTCFETESPDEFSSDAATPTMGTARYYLVTARNRCAEGSLGTRKSGAQRPLGTPCGSLNQNSDGDTWLNIDDDCPLVTNQNQADFEHDGIGDVCDDDNDNDGALNVSDCAPLDVTAFGIPTEIAGVTAAGKLPTSVAWSSQNIGTGTRYDVATGQLSDAKTGNFAPGTCLQNNVINPPYSDIRGQPPAGNGYYYMIRSQNNCGTGTYGSPQRNQHGSQGGGACP